MKNLIYLMLGFTLFLGSCSTGNFAKRKYTKGKYKPERGDYNLAKKSKKKDDTKYVVKTEKNELKQSYKVKTTKNKSKKEKSSKHEISNEEEIKKEEVAHVKENEVEVKENNLILEDQIEETPAQKDVKQEETVAANPASPSTPVGDLGWIFGLISLVLGILSFVFIIMGFFSAFALWAGWVALVFALIAIGLGIASLVIDGNVMGYIGMSFGLATLLIFLFWVLIVILLLI